MKLEVKLFTLALTGLFLSCIFLKKKEVSGIYDDFSSSKGWLEVEPGGNTILPVIKMEVKNRALVIQHKFRTLEEAAEKWDWIESTIDTSTYLCKNYGVIDLDRYHFVVLNIKEKGSSSYFDINGFKTNLGYTTGITVIDLKNYNDDRIRGKQTVKFGIDLQDNHTHLTLVELKFVSELSNEEKKKLIGSGLTIRDENLSPKEYHGLEALKRREDIPLPVIDGEEMAIFRDDATGGITTRLTATPGDDYFGEGEIWSGDGAAIIFEGGRNTEGIPLSFPGEGRVTIGPKGAAWRMWSKKDPDILYLMRKKGLQFSVFSWNKATGVEERITEFSVPEIGAFVEFKRFTPLGNIVAAFRETHHLYIIDIQNKRVRYVKLPTRLKDASVHGNDNIAKWANCYTYEVWWLNLDTGEKGLSPGFSSGHASHGSNGMVANFGGHLNVFVPSDIGIDFTPDDKISVWANWKNDIVTDYGSLTIDNKYVFTNGRKADVDHQHLMISSDDPGAVMRVAHYFTKFSWTSTTYSRPSPDYTKLIYNENAIGSTELHMVYTRRPDPPIKVKLEGKIISWEQPKRNLETSGYYIYGSNSSGHDFVRLNESIIKDTYTTIDDQHKYYTVTSIEHSGLESSFSSEVSNYNAKSFYFEAEEMDLVSPARRFFDGHANGFQTVRINTESFEEASRPGKVTISLSELPFGNYAVWGRVNGKGNWIVDDRIFSIDVKDWEWVSLGCFAIKNKVDSLELTSSDDNLKLDMVLITTDDFIPQAPYPADGNPPEQVKNLKATVNGDQVKLSWNPSDAPDSHHYSVYCGSTIDFKCTNETVIRSVFKTSITDVLPKKNEGLFYKVVAVDSRWNESKPVTVHIY